jgi:cellulose synthase/poly-beta-1,6-N-acetylglucosamine synthase-like glycosyltransferase
MCGFYDAESRPDPRVLLYVAWRRLTARREALVLQGPVFQVRNFFEMGPYCRVAALYQAIAHEWYLPQLFRRLPFTGGTNLYMDHLLLRDLGGYDHGILTEDLELGVRAFVDAGVWPEYLPYASSEQTPPTLRSLFRQRLRWGTGHLQVMDKLRAARHADPGRRRRLLRELFLKGQVEWTLYQLATLVPPAMVVLYALGYMDPHALPSAVHSSLSCLTLTYFGFTFYAYARYFGYLDMSSRPRSRLGWLSTLLLLVILPLAAFLFPVPYSTAMVLKSLGREPKLWVKTPRTAE